MLALVAMSWTPLLLLASPAAAILAWPAIRVGRRHVGRPTTRGLVMSLVVGVSVVLAARTTWGVFHVATVGDVITGRGVLFGISVIPLFLLLLANTYLCLSCRAWLAHGSPARAGRAAWREQRIRMVVFVPLLGPCRPRC